MLKLIFGARSRPGDDGLARVVLMRNGAKACEVNIRFNPFNFDGKAAKGAEMLNGRAENKERQG